MKSEAELREDETIIDGVALKELITHPDERGFFREVIRASDPFFAEGFAQWSHSVMHKGVVKAWHIHQRQVDWWYVPVGELLVVLFDTRVGSYTAYQTMRLTLSGEPKEYTISVSDYETRNAGFNWVNFKQTGVAVLRIPPGVAHGCKALAGPTHLMYVTSSEYDGSDEGRLPPDDPAIGYDWRG